MQFICDLKIHVEGKKNFNNEVLRVMPGKIELPSTFAAVIVLRKNNYLNYKGLKISYSSVNAKLPKFQI